MTKLNNIIDKVMDEVASAITSYPEFNSAHEGYSVLAEEVDELWSEVKVKQGKRDNSKLRAEAIQVAAMAIRFAHDICDSEQAGQK